MILASLFAGMLGYRYFEGLSWLDSFGHAAMILGGMGPYVEPKSEGGKLFEGFYRDRPLRRAAHRAALSAIAGLAGDKPFMALPEDDL